MKFNFLSIKVLFSCLIGVIGLEKYRKQINNYIDNKDYILAKEMLHDKLSNFSKKIISITDTEVEVLGLEKIDINESYLIVANHQSYFDILILLGYLNVFTGFIAKKELLKIPYIKRWLEVKFFSTIDRENIKQSLAVINNSSKLLKDGINQCIFPEGTRTENGEILDFKAGSFKIATKAKSKILPIAIVGSYDMMPKNSFKMYKSNVKLIVLDPINTEELNQTTEIYAQIAQEQISKELLKYDKKERK